MSFMIAFAVYFETNPAPLTWAFFRSKGKDTVGSLEAVLPGRIHGKKAQVSQYRNLLLPLQGAKGSGVCKARVVWASIQSKFH